MAVVERFVRSLGGGVDFDSGSSGTTFRLTLPMAQATQNLSRRGVLIVDDDDLLRGSLARVLLDEGFDVLTAARPEEALNTLRARPDVNVVVLDVHLPDVTGFELAQIFRNENLNVDVIFISGSAEARVQADVQSKPFLAKPFATDELLRRVRMAGRAA
jgi:DNA-binding response OmpR family regulator